MTRNHSNETGLAARPSRLSARVVLALAFAGALSSGCDVHGVSSPGTLATITVTPNATLAAMSSQQMLAVGYDAAGQVVQISPAWSVAGGGGTINTAGMFAAGTVPGLFANTVVASVGGISGSASITVTPGAMASITVVPNPVTLAVTTSQAFVAVGRDASGNIVQFTPTWSVVANGGAIDSGGKFVASGVPGAYTNTVQASNNGIKGFATVNVTAGPLASIAIAPNPDTLIVGAKQQFVAVGKDASGNTVQIAASWAIVAGGGAVDGAGLFTAGPTPGSFRNTLKVSSGTVSTVETIVVIAGPLAHITVTPNPATLMISGAQQFNATGSDVAGNPVAITPAWDVVAGGGSITNAGLFTAGTGSGTFTNTVRASSGGMSGLATVIVTSGPLATITVTPTPVFLPQNARQQFTAVGRDASGNVFVMSPLWSVVNGGGVIDANTGVFTAGAVAGAFVNTVKATSGTIFGTATVTVTAPVPPPPLVNLGAAAPNGIMAGTAFTCVIGGVINANIAISPGSTVTGFPPCVITGVQHLADAIAAQAQIDLTTAYNTLAGLPCPPANAIVGNLGGTTKPAGVYCTASGIGVTGTLTLDGGGDPNATFVFQAGSSLITAGSIVLINGAQAKNVYWQVGSSATIGTASAWQGNILSLTSITLVDNATLLGRALARNGAVSLGTNNIITLP